MAKRTKIHTGIVHEYAKIGDKVYILDHIKYTNINRGDIFKLIDIKDLDNVVVQTVLEPYKKRTISPMYITTSEPINRAHSPIDPQTPFALFDVPLDACCNRSSGSKYYDITIKQAAENYCRFGEPYRELEDAMRIHKAIALYYDSHNIPFPVMNGVEFKENLSLKAILYGTLC